jgi:ABC-2 type transport system ATP-binding protein
MNKGAGTQDVLEACVDAKIKLTKFDPKPATLHEAFVAIVGGTSTDETMDPETAEATT